MLRKIVAISGGEGKNKSAPFAFKIRQHIGDKDKDHSVNCSNALLEPLYCKFFVTRLDNLRFSLYTGERNKGLS
jgi:hypothetical protein